MRAEPLSWRHALLRLEGTGEVAAVSIAAFFGNGLERIVGVLKHYALGFLYAEVRKPLAVVFYNGVLLQVVVEGGRRDAHLLEGGVDCRGQPLGVC